MFFQKKIGKDNSGVHEVNMTPLIDVSLVLVVMLLLATPLAFESSISVRKARKSARAAEQKKIEERIELNVISEDSVRVNRKLVDRRKLGVTLRPLLEQSSSRVVVVECDAAVSHGAFVNVLDQAKVCGATEIAVSGR
jgi:biopolymer transport protein ExbD